MKATHKSKKPRSSSELVRRPEVSSPLERSIGRVHPKVNPDPVTTRKFSFFAWIGQRYTPKVLRNWQVGSSHGCLFRSFMRDAEHCRRGQSPKIPHPRQSTRGRAGDATLQTNLRCRLLPRKLLRKLCTIVPVHCYLHQGTAEQWHRKRTPHPPRPTRKRLWQTTIKEEILSLMYVAIMIVSGTGMQNITCYTH